ncbi:MAG: translation initiation factor eIF-1A [Euryarchaeota archaeon]|nr:translation initiation factor eIF-1A [Euryarchaeota archaeon]
MEEEETLRVPLPDRNKGEMFGIVDKILGGGRMMVMCADGKSRMARIPGKIKRRMWIKEGDLVVIRPWEFQDEKADVVYRYTRTQASYLSKNRKLPELLDVFGQ